MIYLSTRLIYITFDILFTENNINFYNFQVNVGIKTRGSQESVIAHLVFNFYFWVSLINVSFTGADPGFQVGGGGS